MSVVGFTLKSGSMALFMVLAVQLASSQTVIKTSPSYMSQGYIMNPQSSGHGPHAFKIATLYPNNVGDDDHLHIVANVNDGWGATANASIDVLFANRGGFTYSYSARGVAADSNAKMAAYLNTDTSVDIYLMFSDVYSTGSYEVLETTEDTVYPTPTDLGASTPPGTLVFDSSSPNYPPVAFSGFSGKVGIGTANPLSALHVSGNGDQVIMLQSMTTGNPGINFSNTVGGYTNQLDSATAGLYWFNGSARTMTLAKNGNLSLTGSVTYADNTTQSTAWTGVLCGGDYSESVDVSGDRKNYAAGDVLVIDPQAAGSFLKSAEPYSTAVTGIYATKPGVVGRRQKTDPNTSTTEVPMAMIGIVPTRVSAENGPIRPGDLLVTSSTLGYAMKGTDRTCMLGAVIGKALGNLDSGTGLIEAVVTLQ